MDDKKEGFGVMYIVATPIGNLKDITLRAIQTLSEVDFIYAEDTRVTRKLLASLSADYRLRTTHLLSYHQHSSEAVKLEILRHLVSGKNIALVTDAGTPGLSDPGNELIDFILEREPAIRVIPIPGASALTTALSISGFRTDKFVFLGFWPRKKVSKVLDIMVNWNTTFIFYESPHRILKTLELLLKEFGEGTRVCVARELTKVHETIYRGTIMDVSKQLSNQASKHPSNRLQGELVVVVELMKD